MFRQSSLKGPVMTAARHTASCIRLGTLDPLLGAHMIWDLALTTDGRPHALLKPFVRIASESDRRPQDKAYFVEQVHRQVEVLLGPEVDPPRG